MSKMTLIVYSLVRDFSAGVHRDGCRDVKTDTLRHDGHCETIEGDASAAVKAWLGNPEQEGTPANLGYTSRDVKIHNCAK